MSFQIAGLSSSSNVSWFFTTFSDPEELALLRSLYHSAEEETDDGMASNASSSSDSETADADAAAADDVQVAISNFNLSHPPLANDLAF